MEKLLNLFFIPECLFCNKIGSFFCNACLAKCNKLNHVVFLKGSNTKCIFAYEYEGLVRECVRNSKYKNKHFAALRVLAKKVSAEFAPKLKDYLRDDRCLIVPIPITRVKLRSRGFNQAEIIASAFSETLKVPASVKILMRIKETTSQYSNNRVERFKNMKGAFAVSIPESIKGKKIIVVDDVCTTGATLIEATSVLRQAGAKDVLCVTLARKS